MTETGSVLEVGATEDEAGELKLVSLLLLSYAKARRTIDTMPIASCVPVRVSPGRIVPGLYRAGWGDKSAIGAEMSRSRVRRVAIRRPGCMAVLGSESMSPRVSLARSRSSPVSASPHSAASPPGPFAIAEATLTPELDVGGLKGHGRAADIGRHRHEMIDADHAICVRGVGLSSYIESLCLVRFERHSVDWAVESFFYLRLRSLSSCR